MPKHRARSRTSYLTRRRWTAKEAREALSALDRSGLHLTAFAIREGLSPLRLSRWRRRLGPVPASAPTFEEIPKSEIASAIDGDVAPPLVKEPFEIVLSSGRVVRVPTSFDAPALRRLLAVVEEVGAC